jgi:hypothetical protein
MLSLEPPHKTESYFMAAAAEHTREKPNAVTNTAVWFDMLDSEGNRIALHSM